MESPKVAKDECYLCHGKGHWARNCTSLPSMYLVDNPPKCYCCGGIGHYARCCPSSSNNNQMFMRPRAISDPFPYGWDENGMMIFPPPPIYLIDPNQIDSPTLYPFYYSSPMQRDAPQEEAPSSEDQPQVN